MTAVGGSLIEAESLETAAFSYVFMCFPHVWGVSGVKRDPNEGLFDQRPLVGPLRLQSGPRWREP